MKQINKLLRKPQKACILLCLLVAFFLSGPIAFAHGQKVNITQNEMTLSALFDAIEHQTGMTIAFNESLLDLNKKVSVNLKNKSLDEVMTQVLQGSDLTYSIEGKHITLTPKKSGTAVADNNKRTVKGTARDIHTGEPLLGVSVSIKGTSTGTTSDIDGNFSITVTGENTVLVFSYLGYSTQEMQVGSQDKINVQLKEDSKLLDEVVVTALGLSREEKGLGYAVQSVSGNALQTVKGVDMTSSLTGKVAGLVIKNTTEFNGNSTIELRGETPLLVIDGVPYGNMLLKDIPADDIEDISTLKGATAAALYGSRGSSGAIMVTTKKGKGKGLSIDFNSNTMFRAGWTAIPEAQTSYGHGDGGEIADDYVWGPKLDIGTMAEQWNPKTKQYETMPLVSSGKNNFRNFLEPGLLTNNSISLTQTGENGYFRTGLNYVYNKGQYPNQELNKFNYTVSGEIKLGDKFSLESSMGYMRSMAPQVWGGGYGNQGYIYQILMWTAPDYDIRDYKDYWVVPNEKQNWMYNQWYDNPYLIAYEKLQGLQENKLNANLTLNYNILKDLKLIFRNGYDFYKHEDEVRNPAGIFSSTGPSINNQRWNWSGKGMYGQNQRWGQSINSDLMLNYNKNVGKFNFDALLGGSIYYYQDRYQGAKTANGLAVPGWYSLANNIPSTAAGINSIDNYVGTFARQVNSAYGKLSVAWNNAVYLDLTGRNDWSSTQPKEEMSYFYPSVAASVVMSEFFDAPDWLSMWKIRGSWTVTKSPLDVYKNKLPYSTTNSWGYISASRPDNLLGDSNLSPSESRTWEVGTGAYLFGKRLYVDFAYFNKLYYNQQIVQALAPSSGFKETLINTKETFVRRGVEVTVSGSIIKNKTFEWSSTINYSFQNQYYVDIDPVYSKKDQWTKAGKRKDYYALTEKVLRTPQGEMIHTSDGNVWLNDYQQLYGYKDPDFTFGFLNSFTWKNWRLGMTIDGRIGGMMDNYIYGKMFDTGSAPETDTWDRYDEVVNGGKYIGKGVKVASGSATYDIDGNITKDTRVYAPNDIPVSYQEYMKLWGNSWENRIHSATFIKLRELSIGYDFPKKWLEKTFLNTASLSLTGQNLFLWTKDFKYSDPDLGKEDMNAPSQRMIGFDIKIGF